jgi:hypothetical protein
VTTCILCNNRFSRTSEPTMCFAIVDVLFGSSQLRYVHSSAKSDGGGGGIKREAMGQIKKKTWKRRNNRLCMYLST